MTPLPLKPPMWRWYVSCESNKRVGQRAHARATKTFRNEQDAKAFARAKLGEGLNVNAGTLNPYQPKRIITAAQISDWIESQTTK
jgi:hypothetical protein